jgi:type II secretion system protein I
MNASLNHLSPHTRPRRIVGRARSRAGFTLPEVLATLLLVAIVLPSVMQGISLATAAAGTARQRSEATALAESKLNELVATNQWQSGGLSGDFGEQWREYTWQAEVQSWVEPTARQLLVHVVWNARGRNYDVALATLVYSAPPVTSGTTSGTTATPGSTGGTQP